MLLVTAEPVDTTSAVLRISGDIDQDTVPGLDRALDQALDSGYTHLTLHCADLRSCDSSGITALLRAHQTAAAHGGTLELAGTSAVLRSRLQLTGLDQILTLHDDAAALSAEILEVPPRKHPSSIEAQTESLVRLTTHETLHQPLRTPSAAQHSPRRVPQSSRSDPGTPLPYWRSCTQPAGRHAGRPWTP